MDGSWESFISVLTGDLPAPNSKFVSHRGALDEEQVQELHRALAGADSVFGFRLEGSSQPQQLVYAAHSSLEIGSLARITRLNQTCTT